MKEKLDYYEIVPYEKKKKLHYLLNVRKMEDARKVNFNIVKNLLKNCKCNSRRS